MAFFLQLHFMLVSQHFYGLFYHLFFHDISLKSQEPSAYFSSHFLMDFIYLIFFHELSLSYPIYSFIYSFIYSLFIRLFIRYFVISFFFPIIPLFIEIIACLKKMYNFLQINSLVPFGAYQQNMYIYIGASRKKDDDRALPIYVL